LKLLIFVTIDHNTEMLMLMYQILSDWQSRKSLISCLDGYCYQLANTTTTVTVYLCFEDAASFVQST
jgi:hypothetical protein